ncbi:alpha/beta-hydrolase [Microthyrium microscopicum]|uniref:Alpha/beta-hydrolase n=1 Tax=Microthyrium microscopicum TaxID=703497 RepID=A0A6A6UU10_9PEZI|nr:alpha/beta-hydrolase [Microthyrium microscopicum]
MPSYLSLSTATIGVASAVLGFTYARNVQLRQAAYVAISPSPLETKITTLSASEISDLAYPPNALPGARTVSTPYGNCRVYEFGPEDGPKVLLVHGISIPSVGLVDLAKKLVEKGCRVMLFDLYGRGFSDTPIGVVHSSHLYMTQILSVLASSTLPWTGVNAFSLIGYSMGGALAVNFAATFPLPVKSLVLIAPAGLIRGHRISMMRRFMSIAESILPSSLLRRLIRSSTEKQKPITRTTEVQPEMVEQKTPSESNGQEALLRVFHAMKWQVDNNQGFPSALIGSMKYAPLSGQHQSWAQIRKRLEAVGEDDHGLVGRKVAVLLGEDDVQIVREDTEPDIKEALGEQNVKMVLFKVGHELPISMSDEVAAEIWKFWQEIGIA